MAAPGGAPSTEQVWQAVQALYHSKDEVQRKQADSWLQEYQRSSAAWQSLNTLLGTDGLSEETYFFAANCLKSKTVSRDLVEQLDVSMREQLGSQLMMHIHKFRSGQSNTRKQLCLAFAAYAGQFDHTLRPVDIVQEVCTTLGASEETIPVLLELLSLLGEEADRVGRDAAFYGTEHPLLASANRSANAVLNFLQQRFTQLAAGPEAGRAASSVPIVACFWRWLRFGEIPPEQIAQSPIVQAAFAGLVASDPKMTEASSDLMCELAYISRDVQRCLPIFQALSGNLPNLHAAYQRACGDEEDDTLARAVARIVAEMGESYVEVVARSPDQAVPLVDLMVQCGSHPDTKVGSITYAFWWRFKECLFNACGEPERTRALQVLQPAMRQMVQVLAKSASFPTDIEDDDWGTAEEDEFRNFRVEALWDCALDVSEMIGGPEFLHVLVPHLQAEVDRAAGKADAWRTVEGALFLIRAAARYAPDDDASVVPQVLSLYQKLPAHPRVRQAFTIVCGKLGRWLNLHPEALGPLLDYVVQGLGVPHVGKTAAEALQDLCDACGERMAAPEQLNGLLQIYQSIGVLDIQAQERVVEGIGSVLVRVPGNQLQQMIAAVAEPPLKDAMAAMQAQNKDVLINQIKKVRSLIKGSVNNCDRGVSSEVSAARREALSVAWTIQFEKAWPVFEAAIAQFVGQEDLMEHVCRCMKSAMQAMSQRFKQFLGPFATAVVNSYLKHPLSCILYAVDSIVSLFGKHPEFGQPLLDMFAALSSRTMQALNSPAAFQAAPDIVQEYFELAGRGLRRFPQPMLVAPVGAEAFACGVQSFYTPLAHRDALKAVAAFLDNLVLADANQGDDARHAQDKAASVAFLMQVAPSPQGATQPRGLTMMQALVTGLVDKGGVLIEPCALVIMDCGELMRPARDEWLAAALHGVPDAVLPAAAKSACMQAVQQIRVGSGSKDALHDCKAAVRNLQRAVRPQ